MNGMVRQSSVMGLGYLGLGGDIERWSAFATEILGMEVAERTESLARFRMDERAWRLSIVPGAPELSFVGWEVQDPRALDRICEVLNGAGVAPKAATPEEAAARGVAAYVSCEDPAGINLEFFYGPVTRKVAGFRSATGASFVTGEQGMGHVVVATANYEETVDFYTRHLGFGLSDVIVGPLQASFLGPNGRHHSLAIIGHQDDQPRLRHFMVEVDSLITVGQAYDRCIDRGLQLVMTLGCHWNDHMTSFYVESPSGYAVELGWGGRQVDRATFTTALGTGEISFWGHRPMTAVKAAQLGVEAGERP